LDSARAQTAEAVLRRTYKRLHADFLESPLPFKKTRRESFRPALCHKDRTSLSV